MLSIEEIREILENYYGDYTNRGCYVNGRWFDIETIIEILKRNV